MSEEDRQFEEFFSKIKGILKQGAEERGLKEELTTTPIAFKGTYIDMPKKQKDMYHGSVYGIMCNEYARLCKIKGDIVVEEDHDYEVTKTLEESECKVFSVHTHADLRGERKLPYRESHLHFICDDKDRTDTINMINFLKDY